MKLKFTVSALALLFLILAACGSAGNTASAGGITVQVTETDFHIASSITNFIAGKPYHFVVSNQGHTTHEFMLMPKAEGNMSGMPMEDMDKIALASISMINPGATKTLDYTFPASTINSHPEMACYFPGHYEAGMKLAVEVHAA